MKKLMLPIALFALCAMPGLANAQVAVALNSNQISTLTRDMNATDNYMKGFFSRPGFVCSNNGGIGNAGNMSSFIGTVAEDAALAHLPVAILNQFQVIQNEWRVLASFSNICGVAGVNKFVDPALNLQLELMANSYMTLSQLYSSEGLPPEMAPSLQDVSELSESALLRQTPN